MPRKTRDDLGREPDGRPRFNEAAARCRGKRCPPRPACGRGEVLQ